MSITVNCVIDLTEEELMYVLLSRAKLKAAPWPSPEQSAVVAREDAEQAMARTGPRYGRGVERKRNPQFRFHPPNTKRDI